MPIDSTGPARQPHQPRRARAFWALWLPLAAAVIGLAAFWGGSAPRQATAQSAEAQEAAAMATRGAPYTVTALIRKRADRCYDDGANAAMRRLAAAEVTRINAQGGVYGRPIALRLVEADILADRRADDAATAARRDAAREIVYAGVRETLADENALAIIGLSSSTSAERMLTDLEAELAGTDIPYIGAFSVSSVLEKHPVAFSSTPSQETERGPAVAAFLDAYRYQRVAILQRENAIWTASLAGVVKDRLGAERIVGDYTVGLDQSRALDPGALGAVVDQIRAAKPDAIMIGVGTARTPDVLAALGDLRADIFAIARMERLLPLIPDGYPNPVYGLGWDRLPEIYNERLRRLVEGGVPGAWIFEGAKNDAAPGWADGRCEARPPRREARFRDPLDQDNQRAIQRGAIMADMIRLAATAAIAAGPDADVAARRQAIASALRRDYAVGAGVFRGGFGDWSFNPAGVASQTPFILIKPSTLPRLQLAPVQFVRARSGDLKQIDTLYLDLDLVKVNRIDENTRTFFAEFYVGLRVTPTATIDRLDFVNAFIDPRTNGRVLAIEPLHQGGPSDFFPRDMSVYKVSGRFLFEPALQSYPFDVQRFAIDIRPKSGEAFIVQPPPVSFRDRDVASDDWVLREQFVSVGTDFVPVVDAFTHAPSIVPFYTASYVWIMEREATDYYLRVVVPLAFILIVAYLSIFIPQTHFEAIITIQVTALLSAVALYLSLPQLDSDDATVSDKIFLFNYLLTSIMIGISVVRINQKIARRRWLRGLLAAIHILGIPASVVAMAYLIGRLDISGVDFALL